MKAFNKLAKLLLSVSCFMSLITIDQAIATKAADDGEIVDDNDARFVYSSGNSNAGGWDYWPTTGGSDPGETEHWSNSAGATIDITFNGTELYGKLDPSHAMFSVAIDGGTATEHDAYASSRQDRVKVYESAELAPGDHSAKVTVLGKRNANSTGNGTTYGVQFVYAKVYGSSDTGFTVIEDMKTTETDEMFKVKYTGTWGGGESYYPDYFHDGYEHYTSNGYPSYFNDDMSIIQTMDIMKCALLELNSKSSDQKIAIMAFIKSVLMVWKLEKQMQQRQEMQSISKCCMNLTSSIIACIH